jgi:hypothetical protein
LRSPHVHTLCTLEPFLSQHGVVVTPVLAYLDDVSVLEELRAAPGEVSRIFDHPLEALLDPGLAREEGLVPLGSDDWPYEAELHVRLLYFVSPLALPPPLVLLLFPFCRPFLSLLLFFLSGASLMSF